MPDSPTPAQLLRLRDIVVPEGCQRIRGLLWCSATVRHRRAWDDPAPPHDPWQTDWKWCVGVWWPGSGKSVTDPNGWYLPGISDRTGVDVLNVEATHFAPLPPDPSALDMVTDEQAQQIEGME